MLLQEIPVKETSFIPAIVKDYLAGSDFLKKFYHYDPAIGSFEEVIRNRNFDPSKRKLLVEVLQEQYRVAGIGNDALVNQQVNRLGDSKTFTITTGHQLCLFTGPLYFIYKILTAVRLAGDLKQAYPGFHFVPVFWLASEDHDFQEINHIHLFGKKIGWDFNPGNQPVGRISDPSVSNFIHEAKLLFSNRSEENKLLQLFEEEYSAGTNLSVATRRIVHALFKKYGLIVLEPDDKRLKPVLKNVMVDDILKNKVYPVMKGTNKLLEELYKLQINGREINFFYLSESGRHLVKREEDGFIVANTDLKFTSASMQEEISENPEKFSPNVVLRPVYQELILPNLAYIGGPAEIAYWLQLKHVFGLFETAFPVLWLRNSFMLLNKSLLQRMEKLETKPSDYLESADVLSKKILQKEQGFDLNERISAVDEAFQKLINDLTALDNQLASKLIRQKNENAAFVNKLRKEITEKLKEKAQQEISKAGKIKETLFPDGVPQERHDNILQFAADAGFIEQVYAETRSDFNFRILQI